MFRRRALIVAIFAIAGAFVAYPAGAKPGGRYDAQKLAKALKKCRKDKSKSKRERVRTRPPRRSTSPRPRPAAASAGRGNRTGSPTGTGTRAGPARRRLRPRRLLHARPRSDPARPPRTDPTRSVRNQRPSHRRGAAPRLGRRDDHRTARRGRSDRTDRKPKASPTRRHVARAYSPPLGLLQPNSNSKFRRISASRTRRYGHRLARLHPRPWRHDRDPQAI